MVRTQPGGAAAGAALAALLVLVAYGCIASAPPTAPASTPSPTTAAVASPGTPPPASAATPGATSTATPSPSPSPTAVSSPTAPPGSAPTSAAGFPFRKAVVPMSFPLPARAAYEYRNDFFVDRAGTVRWYNHAKRVRADGSLQRAHDGVDIRVPIGTVVLSPFDGRIADPATLWRPWDRARYGLTAVVISEEPTSPGYAALLVHLGRLDVEAGDRVRRGQRVGIVGDTGNAAGLPVHLHFELRAPFPLTVEEAGRIRRLDAFDPYPSLVAADPRGD